MVRISPQNATSHWFRSKAFPSETRFPAGVLRHAAGSRPFPPSCPNGREQECAHPAHLPFCAPDRPSGYAARRAHGRRRTRRTYIQHGGAHGPYQFRSRGGIHGPYGGHVERRSRNGKNKNGAQGEHHGPKNIRGEHERFLCRQDEGNDRASAPFQKEACSGRLPLSWSQGKTRPARGC